MVPTKAVTVALRCRRMLPHERDQHVCVQALGDGNVECFDPDRCRKHAYTFDSVFGEHETTHSLFEQLAAPLLSEVLIGKHSTIFAYGQTGSGKTYTMLGRNGEPGIVQLTLQKLFDGPKLVETSVTVNFVEVYNDKIRDLLHPRCPTRDLRDDPLRGPIIVGVRGVLASTSHGVMELVRIGNARRSEEITAANPVSSRSHAVLQLVFETDLPPTVDGGASRKRFSKFSLIDLAGSERAASTDSPSRLREVAMINRSLLALANCITALARKDAYVNYRDSKLTRLLKDSFSGNCFTTMIAHVSPSISSFDETINTLKYAHRACQIRGMCGGVQDNIWEVEGPRSLSRSPRSLSHSRSAPLSPRPPRQLSRQGELTESFECSVCSNLKLDMPSSLSRSSTASSLPRISRQSFLGDDQIRALLLADGLERTREQVLSKLREWIHYRQVVAELNNHRVPQIKLDAVSGTVSGETMDQKQDDGNPLRTGAGEAPEDDAYLLQINGVLHSTSATSIEGDRCWEDDTVGEASGDIPSPLDSIRAAIEAMDDDMDDEDEDSTALEQRLLQAQQAISLLEIEKVETEQRKRLFEASLRNHEQALGTQKIQLDVQGQALVSAQDLLAKHGLIQEWQTALGPLEEVLPASLTVQSCLVESEVELCHASPAVILVRRQSSSDKPDVEPSCLQTPNFSDAHESSSMLAVQLGEIRDEAKQLDLRLAVSVSDAHVSSTKLAVQLGEIRDKYKQFDLRLAPADKQKEAPDTKENRGKDNALEKHVVDHKVQVIAASAAVGALVVGAGVGTAGLVSGGVVGASVGILPAFVTFGLSIPVSAAIGAGTGLFIGATAGGAVGAVGGAATGYTTHTYRHALKDIANSVLIKAFMQTGWSKAKVADLESRTCRRIGSSASECC